MCNVNVVNRISCFCLIYFYFIGDWDGLAPSPAMTLGLAVYNRPRDSSGPSVSFEFLDPPLPIRRHVADVRDRSPSECDYCVRPWKQLINLLRFLCSLCRISAHRHVT